MSTFSRRKFSHALGATTAVGLAGPALGVSGANEQIRLGFIGCGGRSRSLVNQFGKLSGVKVVAIADPDTKQMEGFMKAAKGLSDFKPVQYQDYRKLLERDDVDAVVIASPNYWHTLQTIHACQAGKDVYVEKPVTHNLVEGAKMVEAGEKYGRIIQAGTQNRSDTGLIPAFEMIQKGELGKITAVRGLCYRNRQSIGKLSEPLKPPATCDYNLWLGPREDVPILRPKLHYDWHWDFNTGNGDIGNQGPHEMDLIAWVLGDKKLPGSVRSFGNRFGWNDGGDTANMQTAWFEMNGVPVIFEVNDMWMKPKTNASPAYKGIRVGVIVTCEGGEFRGGRGGGNVFAEDGKTKIHKFPGDAGGSHAQNFLDAVRSRKSEDLRGKIANSVQSAALSHLANISMRSGSLTPGTKIREELAGSADLLDVIDRQERQLSHWTIDTDKTPYFMGAEVKVDPASGQVQSPGAAVTLATPTYRKGFELPASV